MYHFSIWLNFEPIFNLFIGKFFCRFVNQIVRAHRELALSSLELFASKKLFSFFLAVIFPTVLQYNLPD